MDKKSMTVALGLLLLAGSAPAMAYHIGSANTFDSSSLDWTGPGAAVIVCESDGLNDVRNPDAVPHGGTGGLCTVGETRAAGATTWGATLGATPPAASVWVRLDACDVSCSAGAASNVNFTAELGPYTCFVDPDEAFYYKALYAWWTYDGDGSYASQAEEDGYHGHVGMFVGPVSGGSPSPTAGTAEVSHAAPPGGLEPCGSSPTTGPAVAANE